MVMTSPRPKKCGLNATLHHVAAVENIPMCDAKTLDVLEDPLKSERPPLPEMTDCQTISA
jgi:hypothetical protein